MLHSCRMGAVFFVLLCLLLLLALSTECTAALSRGDPEVDREFRLTVVHLSQCHQTAGLDHCFWPYSDL